MVKIYLASPYTLGDVAMNVRVQMDAAHEIIKAGHCPFIPLLSHFQHMVHPEPYDVWLNIDMEWMEACDVVLRLPGTSQGADLEVARAKRVGIPVFYTVEEFTEWEKGKK